MSSVLLLRLTIAVTCVVSIYQALLFYLGTQTSSDFDKLWNVAFVALLVFWVDADSKDRPEVYRPSFDFGLFIYLAWIAYLPYYLIRTRGRMGWLWLLGLVVLALLGTLLQLAVYAAS